MRKSRRKVRAAVYTGEYGIEVQVPPESMTDTIRDNLRTLARMIGNIGHPNMERPDDSATAAARAAQEGRDHG